MTWGAAQLGHRPGRARRGRRPPARPRPRRRSSSLRSGSTPAAERRDGGPGGRAARRCAPRSVRRSAGPRPLRSSASCASATRSPTRSTGAIARCLSGGPAFWQKNSGKRSVGASRRSRARLDDCLIKQPSLLRRRRRAPSNGQGGRSPGVHAALSVMELVVAQGRLGLGDIARELQLPKSTLHRICAILVDRGWAIRDEHGRYEPGVRAIGLGSRAADLPIVTGFRHAVSSLMTRYDETVCLAVLDGRRVGLRRDRGDHAARPAADLGRPPRTGVRVRERACVPRRPGRPRRSRPSSVGVR